MKVKLSLGNNEFIGYRNINPFTELKHVHDNSATEIYCDQEVLSKVANSEFAGFINGLVSKLRRGGSIIFNAPDMSHIAMAYLHRKLDEAKLSEILGESRGYYNCRLIENALRGLNLKIDSMSINNFHFVVKGIRL